MQEPFYVTIPLYKVHTTFTAKKDRDVVQEAHPMLLPHEMVGSLYRQDERMEQFKKIMGEGADARLWWQHWREVDAEWARLHPVNPFNSHVDPESCFPLGLHGDDVKYRSAGGACLICFCF